MATRTVSVLLTGTVTPYVSAMRTAARAAQATGRDIERAMAQAASSSRASAVTMGRDIQREAGRAAGRASTAFSSMGVAAGTAASWTSQRWNAASTAVSSRWAAASANMAGSMGGVGTAAGAASNWVSSRWSQASAAVASRWSVASAAVSGAMAAVGAAAGPAASWVSARWAAAGAAVSSRWAATSAAVSSAMAATSATAGSAASWLASRWTAAAAAVSGAFSSMTLAAYAAGASIMGIANDGRKSLEAMRMASLGLVAVFGLAAFAAARFEKAMSEVRAVTGGSAGDMKKLSQAALEAGQATVYSATQAAKAEAELARAGISTADIIGGALKGSLDLAASGQLELSESAIISAQAMNAFKLKGGDVGHIADVISAGAGKSATNVHAMGLAFRQAALLSSQTGLSLEQTVGTLSLFAQNALVGSDAGTSLKVMLQRLVPQSKEAANMMQAIGFSAYDASGNFIGLTALADMMKTSFAKLTPEARNAAMATIFGSDAVRAATVLYEAGGKGIDQWVNSVNDAGYATRVAATMTDNLSGDLERLKGALETALISSGSSGNQVLRDMAQSLAGVVNWYNQLSPALQSNVTILAGLVGILGFVGSGLLLMLPRIMAVRAELVALGVTAARTRAALLGIGGLTVILATLGAIAYGIDKLSQRFREAPPNVNKLAESLVDFAQKGQTSGEMARLFGKNLDKVGEAVARIAHPGGLDRVEDFFSTFDPNADAGPSLEAAREKIKALDDALAGLVSGGATDEAAENFERMAAEAAKHGTSAEKLMTLLPQYDSALAANSTQAKLAAGSQKQLGDATSMTADQLQDTRSQADKLKDSLDSLNGVAISAAEKEISFRASLADLTDTVKENGRSLDITSEAGRKVKGSFLDAAQAAMAHAQAVAEQKDSIEAGNVVLEQDIVLLRRQMEQSGFSKQAIDALLGSYAKMPTNVETKVGAPGATQATAEMEALRQKIAATPAGKSVTVTAPTAGAIGELTRLGYKVETLPDGRVTITVPTSGAVQALDGLQARINSLQGRTIGVGVYLKATASDADANGIPDLIQARRNGGLVGYAGGGAIRGYPTGGAVRGPGSGTSDSILARISNGEYVVKAASVRQYGVAMLDQLNAGRLSTAGYTARPAAQYGVSHNAGQVTNNKTNNVTLNGAKQSSAEQVAEVMRHLAFTN